MGLLEYKDFIGISNAKDLKRIPPGYVRAAVNVDIDDTKKLHRRRGKKLLSGTASHSIWSNSAISLCVQGGDLKEVIVAADMTVSFITLLTGVGNTSMQYQPVADIVFFFNQNILGYVRDHSAYVIPDIDQRFKAKIMGGHLVEFWNNRLWVFQNEFLVYSDAARPFIMDERHNHIPFVSRGRMVRGVKDGLYVSDGERCMFLQGGEGDPPRFKRMNVTNSPCIEGTSVVVDGEEIGPGVVTKAVYWTTKEGCYRGLEGGQVNRVTGPNFYLEGVSKGRAMIMTRTLSDGRTKVRQYLVAYDFYPGYGGIRADIEIPAMRVNGKIGQS